MNKTHQIPTKADYKINRNQQKMNKSYTYICIEIQKTECLVRYLKN